MAKYEESHVKVFSLKVISFKLFATFSNKYYWNISVTIYKFWLLLPGDKFGRKEVFVLRDINGRNK